MSELLNGTPIIKCIEYCAARGYKDIVSEAYAELAELLQKAELVNLVDDHFCIDFDKMREDNDQLRANLEQAKINDQAYWVAQNIMTSQLLEQNKTLAQLRAENAELTRKGERLCEQCGTLLMESAEMREALEPFAEEYQAMTQNASKKDYLSAARVIAKYPKETK